jgi:hypothetical protein
VTLKRTFIIFYPAFLGEIFSLISSQLLLKVAIKYFPSDKIFKVLLDVCQDQLESSHPERRRGTFPKGHIGDPKEVGKIAGSAKDMTCCEGQG